jgi:sulfur carrier protein ThiS
MKIHFEYGKLLKIDDYASGSIIDVPDKCTVRDLLVMLKLPVYLQKAVAVHVNGEPVWSATILKENDNVRISRILSGG